MKRGPWSEEEDNALKEVMVNLQAPSVKVSIAVGKVLDNTTTSRSRDRCSSIVRADSAAVSAPPDIYIARMLQTTAAPVEQMPCPCNSCVTRRISVAPARKSMQVIPGTRCPFPPPVWVKFLREKRLLFLFRRIFLGSFLLQVAQIVFV